MKTIMKQRTTFLAVVLASFSMALISQENTSETILISKVNKISTYTSNDNGFLQTDGKKEATNFTINTSIELNGNTGEQDIDFEVQETSNLLSISIHCLLESGASKIEVRDPMGNKKGEFQLKGTNNKTDGWEEKVNGHIQKQFNNPMKGDWKIRIYANQASALVDITAQQQQ